MFFCFSFLCWTFEIDPCIAEKMILGDPTGLGEDPPVWRPVLSKSSIPKSLVESSKFPARGWANLEFLSCFWGPRKGTHSIMSYSQPPSIRASICAWIHIIYLCINININIYIVCASQLRHDFKGDISLLSLILSHLFPNLFHSVSQAIFYHKHISIAFRPEKVTGAHGLCHQSPVPSAYLQPWRPARNGMHMKPCQLEHVRSITLTVVHGLCLFSLPTFKWFLFKRYADLESNISSR